MIRREIMWKSFERIAERGEISVYKLAQLAGLDQSALAPSRRKNREKAWPSLRTLAAILNTYELSLDDWIDIVEEIEREEG